MVENLEHRLRVTPEMASIKSAYDRVFINGFTTIAKPLLEFKTEDKKVLSETWHKVKGWGDAPFDVLFNPDKQQWLKIVPPSAEDYKVKRGLLIEGAKIVRTSLATSGLQSYAEKVEDCSLKIDGSPTVGFKTKHLGPTQDFIIRQLSKSKTSIDFETAEALSSISIEAFNLAAELYVTRGIWMADPNLGNIVINFDNSDEPKVTLIDFEKPPQYRKVNKNGFSELFRLFKNEAEKSGISISKEHEGIVDVDILFSKVKNGRQRVKE